MKVRSLGRRILTIVLTAQLLCAILLSAFALLHERRTRLRAFDESLKGRSDSVLGAIQDAEDKDNQVTVDPRELRIPRGDVFQVYAANGNALGGTLSAPPQLIKQQAEGFRDEHAGRDPYRVYQRSGLRIIDRAETAGIGRSHTVVIVYAASKRHLQHEIYEAAGVYTTIILIAVLGTGLLVILLVRQALQPLGEFADAAQKVSAPALNFQVPASVLEVRELRPLADVLNAVIAKLRDAFTKERRFVGDAAHELKTAVAVVRSTVQVLMLKPRTIAEYGDGLHRALEDVSRIEALIAQMLSSASTDDENTGNPPPLNLNRVAGQVLQLIYPFAEARLVELHLVSGEEVKVRLREDRAVALLSNLIVNAVQHSGPGMQVDVCVSKDALGRGLLEVTDAGSGIGPAALPHVFERFYREDGSRSRETGGAGLGLAICKSIVEAAGGTIAIRSEPGRGTSVNVVFMES